MKKSLLEKLIIDSKKPIFEIQIGEKRYITNAKDFETAFRKSAREHFGAVGVLIRGREARLDDKKHKVMPSGSWRYISSKYIFNRLLSERLK